MSLNDRCSLVIVKLELYVVWITDLSAHWQDPLMEVVLNQKLDGQWNNIINSNLYWLLMVIYNNCFWSYAFLDYQV